MKREIPLRLDPRCLPVKAPLWFTWATWLMNDLYWHEPWWAWSAGLTVIWLGWFAAWTQERRIDIFELWWLPEKGTEE